MDSKQLDETGLLHGGKRGPGMNAIPAEQCKAAIKVLKANEGEPTQNPQAVIDAAHINLRVGSKSICTPQGLKAIFPGVRSFLPMRNPHLVDALGQSGADEYEARLTAGLK